MNSTFKVQWKEKVNNSTLPNSKTTLIQAGSVTEAKSKVLSRISNNVKVSDMKSFKFR